MSVLRQTRRTEGVAGACALDMQMGSLAIAANHQVQIVEIDPSCPLLTPWGLITGQTEGLQRKDTVIVDDLVLRNDPARVGDVIKLNERELRIVAITHGNKSFTTPFVYVSRRTFTTLGGASEQVSFVIVRVAAGVDQRGVVQNLLALDPTIAVVPAPELRAATIAAMINAGVGMIFVVVFIGVLVGMLIITLTMYTATVERLRDFAVLKALGATRWNIRQIVLAQVCLETILGFVIGVGGSLGVNYAVESASGIRAIFPPAAVVASLGLILALALLGSFLSIRKAVTVDPAMVFRA